MATLMTNNLEAYRCYSLGVEKAQSLHNKEAIALLERAISLDPEFAMAHARIGYAHSVTWGHAADGKPYLERAYRLSNRLTEKDRLYITAWYALANLDYLEAIRVFRELTAKYPAEVEAYLRLCLLLSGEGRYEEALAAAQQALVIDPTRRPPTRCWPLPTAAGDG